MFVLDLFVGWLQWISVPFALGNPAVSDITVSAVTQVYQAPWRGSVSKGDTWVWIDNFCLLVNINSETVLIHVSLQVIPLKASLSHTENTLKYIMVDSLMMIMTMMMMLMMMMMVKVKYTHCYSIFNVRIFEDKTLDSGNS